MSFREKSAWISLTTALGIWGAYAVMVGRGLGQGEAMDRWLVALFVECAIVSLVIQFGLKLLAGFRAPEAERGLVDEREAVIEGRAARLAYTLLIGAVLGVALVSALVIGVGLPVGDYRLIPAGPWNPTVVMANGLLIAVVLAEVLKSATVLILYRRAV